MGIIAEKDDPVTAVILRRPDVHHAVDRPKAEAMSNEFCHGVSGKIE